MDPRIETPTAEDNCPKWANDLILQLRLLEERLGNIKRGDDWLKQDVQKLFERVSDSVHLDDAASEAIFDKIVKGLRQEGFDNAAVAAMINKRIPCPGNLTYCNSEEVAAI